MNFAIIDNNKDYCEFLSKVITDVCPHKLVVSFYDNTYDMEKAEIIFDLLFINIDVPHIDGLEYGHSNTDKKGHFYSE